MINTVSVDFPALSGDVVTERHTRICRERGHATHTVDGVDTGSCPRCGDVTTPTATVPAAFERMLKLEGDANVSRAVAAMAPTFWERDRAADRLEVLKSELFSLVDSLTPAEQAAYQQYRS